MFVVEEAALSRSEIVIDTRLAVAHHPSGSGGVERQALARFEIFLLVFRVGLLFSGDAEYFDVAGERVIGSDPGAVEGQGLAQLVEQRNDFFLISGVAWEVGAL